MHDLTALIGRCQPADLQAKVMRGPNWRIHLTRWAVTAPAERHRGQNHRPGLPGPRRPQLAGDANVRRFDFVWHALRARYVEDPQQ
jgi:hypothetical protein